MKRPVASGAVVLGVIFGFEQVGEYDLSETSGASAIRTIQTAEAEYRALHGHYRDPGWLARGSCSADADGAPLLNPRLEERIRRRGYHFEFHAGPPAVTSSAGDGPSTALSSFAVVVRPIPKAAAGRTAYCGDDSNRIYRVDASAADIATGGRCHDRTSPFGSRSR